MVKTQENDRSLNFVIGVMILGSILAKISGLIKIQVLTWVFGIQSRDLDLFNAANIIPEFIFSIIVLGGLNAILIPLFVKNEKQKEQFEKTFFTILNLFLIFFISLAIITILFANPLVLLLNHLFSINLSAEEMKKFEELLKILMLSPIFLSTSSLITSVLQAKKKFIFTSITTLAYNIGFVLGIIVAYYYDKNVIFVAWGTVIASMFHLIIQIPELLRYINNYKPTIDLHNKELISSLKQIFPRLIGVSAEYIGIIFQNFISLGLAYGSLNALKIAISLRDMAIGIIGIPIAQSVFPFLSEEKVKNVHNNQTLIYGIKILFILLFPILSIFIVLNTPIVIFLFGLNESNYTGISIVSLLIEILAITIITSSLNGILNRVYYALGDIKTTTYISIFILILNILLSFSLVHIFRIFVSPTFNIFSLQINWTIETTESQVAIAGIATTISLCSIINNILLIFFLKKKHKLELKFLSLILKKKLVNFFITTLLGFLLYMYTSRYIESVFLVILINSIFIVLSFYTISKIIKDDDIVIIDKYIIRAYLYIKSKTNFIKFN
ncbi:MAG: oligosaccharide flippase family protein [Candidatus Dojkabacteria bacterium]|nr:oligosaccharide flippase family protein [Candidatus Dojkabacteria bacterium]